MARRKAFSLFLVVVLVLVVAFSIADVTQSDLVICIDRDGIHFIFIEADAPAAPVVLACDGCSGGDDGPD